VTRIDFYHYAEDKLRYACRLAATVLDRDSRLVVYASDEKTLAGFDRLLWTFQSTRFVPHCRATDAIAGETPVILASGSDVLPHHDVLMNLDAEWPPFFASFERLLEIVAQDEEDKQRARGRYVFYRKRGYDIRVNSISEA
jgi:DNA polymerase III subunit chi